MKEAEKALTLMPIKAMRNLNGTLIIRLKANRWQKPLSAYQQPLTKFQAAHLCAVADDPMAE